MRLRGEAWADGHPDNPAYPEAQFDLGDGRVLEVVWLHEEPDDSAPGYCRLTLYREGTDVDDMTSTVTRDWPGEWSEEGWQALKAALPRLLMEWALCD